VSDDPEERDRRWTSGDAIESLAREQAKADPSGQPPPDEAPPVPREVLDVPREGLESSSLPPKRVLIIGAGMAGLVAAYELKREGHDPVVLEAQGRVGGRVYTLRAPFAPGLHAEAGAMRIPRTHDLTIEYCRLFNLPMRPFVMGNPNGIVYIGGERMTAAEANEHPERLPFNLSSTEHGRSADALWQDAIGEIRSMVETDGEQAWQEIVRRYDEYSLYEFLKSKGFSEGAIEFYAVMNFVESDLHNSFVEVLREELGGAYVDMSTIAGGMDALPNAFFTELQDVIRLGAEVRSIRQDGDSVTLTCRVGMDNLSFTGDYAICTVPFSVLRPIEHRFSREKERAIRQLNYHASTKINYHASTKILLQVRDRIWETSDGIVDGGATVTDLPARRLNYPPQDESTRRGVLLASYTWGQDALQWGAMDEETRIEEALDDVAQIHPGIREVFEVGASHAWYGDRWARGAFALFAPEQQTQLQSAILQPEGRVYFAGEHCSLYHAWIQGALESGIRAAQQIHELPSAQ
jgi:monoamine oxidase